MGRRGQVKNRKKHAAIPIAQSQYMVGTLNVTKAAKDFSKNFCRILLFKTEKCQSFFHSLFKKYPGNNKNRRRICQNNQNVNHRFLNIT